MARLWLAVALVLFAGLALVSAKEVDTEAEAKPVVSGSREDRPCHTDANAGSVKCWVSGATYGEAPRLVVATPGQVCVRYEKQCVAKDDQCTAEEIARQVIKFRVGITTSEDCQQNTRASVETRVNATVTNEDGSVVRTIIQKNRVLEKYCCCDDSVPCNEPLHADQLTCYVGITPAPDASLRPVLKKCPAGQSCGHYRRSCLNDNRYECEKAKANKQTYVDVYSCVDAAWCDALDYQTTSKRDIELSDYCCDTPSCNIPQGLSVCPKKELKCWEQVTEFGRRPDHSAVLRVCPPGTACGKINFPCVEGFPDPRCDVKGAPPRGKFWTSKKFWISVAIIGGIALSVYFAGPAFVSYLPKAAPALAFKREVAMDEGVRMGPPTFSPTRRPFYPPKVDSPSPRPIVLETPPDVELPPPNKDCPPPLIIFIPPPFSETVKVPVPPPPIKIVTTHIDSFKDLIVHNRSQYGCIDIGMCEDLYNPPKGKEEVFKLLRDKNMWYCCDGDRCNDDVNVKNKYDVRLREGLLGQEDSGDSMSPAAAAGIGAAVTAAVCILMAAIALFLAKRKQETVLMRHKTLEGRRSVGEGKRTSVRPVGRVVSRPLSTQRMRL